MEWFHLGYFIKHNIFGFKLCCCLYRGYFSSRVNFYWSERLWDKGQKCSKSSILTAKTVTQIKKTLLFLFGLLLFIFSPWVRNVTKSPECRGKWHKSCKCASGQRPYLHLPVMPSFQSFPFGFFSPVFLWHLISFFFFKSGWVSLSLHDIKREEDKHARH